MTSSDPPASASEPENWHGFPRSIDSRSAELLVAVLNEVWAHQRRASGGVPETEVLATWFDPVARGARLRRVLDGLEPVVLGHPEEQHHLLTTHLLDVFVLDAGHGRLLLTPEGRWLLLLLEEQLLRAPAGDIFLGWTATDRADAALLAAYRGWSMQRIRSVISLRTGGAPPLLPQAVALVLFLMINENFGESNALAVAARETDRQALDRAVAAITGAFVDVVSEHEAGERRASVSAYSLSSGYAISEARRRLGADLNTSPLYLTDGSERRIVERLAQELARRDDLPLHALEKANDALVTAYGQVRPVLAAYGVARGTTQSARRVTQELLVEITGQRASTARQRAADTGQGGSVQRKVRSTPEVPGKGQEG